MARDHCERARNIWSERCLGVSWELDTNDWILLSALLDQGELAEVARRVPLLLRSAEARGDLYAATNLMTSFAPRIRLAADQPLEARREGAQAVRAWSRDGFHLQHYNFELVAEGLIPSIRSGWDKMEQSQRQVRTSVIEGEPVGSSPRLAGTALALNRAR